MADICPKQKTLQDFRDNIAAKVAAKICPGKQLPENHPLAQYNEAFAAMLFQQDGNTHRRFRSLAFIDEMCCDDLIAIAADYGIIQNVATQSRGCVTITGNAGALIPADMEFIGDNGITYRLDTAISNPAAIGIDGTATVCLVSIEPGIDSNIQSGEIETSQSYPDIDPEATIDETGIFGGSDVEDCESVRARFKERRRRINSCGNQEWYTDQILNYPGVSKVCYASCECSSCGGCCKSGYLIAYPFFDGYPNGIAPQGVLDDLTTTIFGTTPGDGSGLAPLGAQGEFVQAQVLDTEVVIECVDTPTPRQLTDITEAIAAWYSASLCVGSSYCPSELNAVIKNAAPDLCPCKARIEGVGVVNEPADCPETGQIPCGFLPVFTQVRFE